MKITLEEINNLQNSLDEKSYDNIRGLIEESEEYYDMVQNILWDFKPYISAMLEQAIDCGFDKEILENDYGYNEEMIEILIPYGKNELEVEL